MPVGLALVKLQPPRWGGIVDATTGFVTGVTDSGQNGRFSTGQPLPEATNALVFSMSLLVRQVITRKIRQVSFTTRVIGALH